MPTPTEESFGHSGQTHDLQSNQDSAVKREQETSMAEEVSPKDPFVSVIDEDSAYAIGLGSRASFVRAPSAPLDGVEAAHYVQDGPRKRKAEDFVMDSALLKRRGIVGAPINTDFPRGGSLPPDLVMANTPERPKKEALHRWVKEMDTRVALHQWVPTTNTHVAFAPMETQTLDPPKTAGLMKDTEESQGQTAPNAVAAEMLNAFRQAGIPTDQLTGGMFAIMAQAIAGQFANTVNHSTSCFEGVTGNMQYLNAENNRLRMALDATATNLDNLAHRFDIFQKRASVKEMQKDVAKISEEIKKLREPDVTLETLSKQIDGFRTVLKKQDGKIETFKSNCATELERLGKARKEFNKDVKDHKTNRKSDLKDMELRMDGLEEKLEILDETRAEVSGGAEDEEWKETASQIERKIDASIHELLVLKKHVAEMAEDGQDKWEEQEKFNRGVSRVLQPLKETRSVTGGN